MENFELSKHLSEPVSSHLQYLTQFYDRNITAVSMSLCCDEVSQGHFISLCRRMRERKHNAHVLDSFNAILGEKLHDFCRGILNI